jgi:hypothetical protein
MLFQNAIQLAIDGHFERAVTKQFAIRCRVMRRALAMVILSCVLVTAPRADEDADRQRYVGEIDGLLDGIVGDLDRVAADSGTNYLDYAINKANEVKDKAGRLAAVRGTDDRARRYADAYPGYADKFKEAIGYFRSIKEKQRELDSLPRLCEDKQRELADRIRRYVDANNPEGLEAIPTAGRELGRPLREAVEQADRRKSELESWKDRVKAFSESDGKWSAVRAKLHEAADATHEPWKRAWEQSKRSCNDLVKEDRNPAVEAALRLLADGEKVRQELYRELDRQLDDVARAVDDLERDSTEYDVETALRSTDELKRQLDKLAYAKGDDRRAGEMVRSWPRFASALRETLDKLRTLKQGQFLVDKAPSVCKDSQDRLNDAIRGIVDARDHDQRDKIPLLARNLGASIEEKLRLATSHDSTMRSGRDAILGFSISEGKWQAVATNLKDSATAIFKYWEDALTAAHRACDELAKGEGHPDVVRAMKLLDDNHSATENELARSEADHRRWYEQVRELRGWYKQDTKNVRDMFCSLEESPGDTAQGDAYAALLTQIADRMRGRLAPRWNELMAESGRILQVLGDLKRAPEAKVRSRAAALYDKLDATVRSLTNLMNDELKGANDPEFRALLETGKNEHRRIQASSLCQVSEVAIPGAGVRIDCVKVADGICTLIEIKPKNASAIARGEVQAAGYVASLKEFFLRNRDDIQRAFSGNLEVFKQCIANQRLELRPLVETYELCPAEGSLFRDAVVTE